MDFELKTIQSVEIGSIRTRKLDAPVQLDSYQDGQLNHIREEWFERIDRRKHALEAQIAGGSEQTGNDGNENHAKMIVVLFLERTFSNLEREVKLLEELVRVTEERNMAELPPVRSGLPGEIRNRLSFLRTSVLSTRCASGMESSTHD